MPRALLPWVGMLLASVGAVFASPRMLPWSVAAAVCAAIIGTRYSTNPHPRAVIRHAILAATAFGYPTFVGGTLLAWAATGLHLGLVFLGWSPAVAGRARLVVPQVLAGGVGIAIAAAATQFFFPSVWRWVAMVALAAFLALLTASMPQHGGNMLPSPMTCVAVLALSEALLVLRFLPTHWTINGAILALALAAAFEQRRTPRALFASLLLTIFFFGVRA